MRKGNTMLLTITKKELERIETLMIPAINRDICENKKIISVMTSLGAISLALFIFLYYSGALAFITSFILSLFCYILMLCFGIWSIFPVKIYPVEISTKSIKKAIIEKLTNFYLQKDDTQFLKALYDMSLLNKDFQEKLDQFLKKNEKSVENYLKSLSKESLTMLAQPYKDQINKDINEAVENYLMEKNKELELEKMAKNEKENAEQAFKKECENLLYSAMPKNLTKKDCHAF